MTLGDVLEVSWVDSRNLLRSLGALGNVLFLIEALKISEYHLVGHSLGGGVAQNLALMTQEKLK